MRFGQPCYPAWRQARARPERAGDALSFGHSRTCRPEDPACLPSLEDSPFSLPPIIFPGRPEGRRSDEALKAETDAPQATLEQGHQATGDILALRRRGFFSAGVLFSMVSHIPVETAQ